MASMDTDIEVDAPDVDGMSARPMARKDKERDVGWFRKLRENWARPAELGFAAGRPSRRAATPQPDFGFLDLFRSVVEDKQGRPHKLSMKERFMRGYQLGAYRTEAAIGGIVKGGKYLAGLTRRYKPDEVDPYQVGDLKDMKPKEDAAAFQEQAKQREDRERQEARQGAEQPSSEEEARRRFSGEIIPGRPKHGMNTYYMPQDTRHQAGSNYVGPERQVRRNDDPWPLDRPKEGAKGEMQKPSAQKGAASTMSRGAAAAEKGREAAHKMAARADQVKTQGPAVRAQAPKVVGKPKLGRGQER